MLSENINFKQSSVQAIKVAKAVKPEKKRVTIKYDTSYAHGALFVKVYTCFYLLRYI